MLVNDEIVIVHYYKSIVDGVMTSLIDLFYNLRDKLNISFYIICPELYSLDHNDYYNFPLNQTEFTRDGKHIEFEEWRADKDNEVTCSIPFLKYNNNFGDPKLLFSVVDAREKELYFENKILICSARLLYEMKISKVNMSFYSDNLIVLDSLDTYRSNIGDIQNIDRSILPMKDRFFLTNPATFNPNVPNITYYHKFSKRRLDSMKNLNDVYTYKREGKKKIKIGDNTFENIGKGIFEHLYHGKKVNYSTEGMTMKDGLYYYLSLFGIDGGKDHFPLKISRTELKRKLFMHNNDILLQIIRCLNEIT